MRLRLERLEDRNAPSDLTALEPQAPPPAPEVTAAAYYPHYGPSGTYDQQLPAGNPYYFLGAPVTTVPPEILQLLPPPPPPVAGPPIPPELQTV